MMQTMIQATALTVLTLLLRRVLRGRLTCFGCRCLCG